jgi:mRNA-degrading endonuclease RelE of RelBE toxin-antitoxin system
VRIDVHPRLRKQVERLSASERKQIAAALRTLGKGFGNPHHHSGLGIRRLRKDLFECCAGLQWRIVFFAEKGTLTAYDVMTHDEIKAWLRSF